MANFVTTLSKLTSSADYLFWKIHIKSAFALIIYPRCYDSKTLELINE